MCQPAGLGSNALEDVVDERVHDAHSLAGDTSVIAAKVGQADGDIQSRMKRARTMTDVNSAVVDGWDSGVKALLFSDCSCKPHIPRVSAHHG